MQIKFLLYFLIACNSLLSAQKIDTEYVAKIGNIFISQKDFIARYELTPIMYKHMKNDEEALKEIFLHSLIAEKLLALQAGEKNLDTSEIVQYSLNYFKRMFVRDELYREEIIEKSKPLADSLLDFYITNPSSIFVKYISSNKFYEINNIYRLLEKNVPFDSLYVELSPEDTSKMNIQFGQLNSEVEKKLFSLKENSFSEPVAINDKWFLFKILRKDFAVLNKHDNWQSIYNAMAKKAKEEAEEFHYENFKKHFFSDKKTEANGYLLKSLAEKILHILSEKKWQQEKFYLDISDLLKIEYELGIDTVNMTYIKLNSKLITLKDFIRSFRFDFFSTLKKDFNTIAAVLNKKTKEFIEKNLLADEGFSRGLQNANNVKESYTLWRDNYLSQLVQEKFIDSLNVTDEEALDYFNKQKNGSIPVKQVNIIEVLTHDLKIAEKVLNELNNGEDISRLAKLYSERNFTKETNGVFGYFPVTMYGNIGRIAANMKIGEIYGPLKVREGYSIFKLIGKKDTQINSLSFEEEKNNLKNEIGYIKMQKLITSDIVDMANKYNVEINYDVLKNINVTNVNSFAYRLLGFGGRITAVPLVVPHFNWIEAWQKSTKSLP